VAAEPKSGITKNIVALGIIVVAIASLIYSSSDPARFETYSRFGLSFEYPEGMELSEQGMGGVGIATITAGIVQGTLVTNTVPEIIGVIWFQSEPAFSLEDVLDMAFNQLGEGNIAESRGNLVTTVKDGYEMLRQDFMMNEEGTLLTGVLGTWYDSFAERIYLTLYLSLPTAIPSGELMNRFDRFVSSLENRFEAFPETSLPVYWPTEGWRTASPEEVGVDSGMLDDMIDIIREGERGVDSVLVVKDGYLVMDEYFEPFAKGERHKIYSCTKSVVSTLIGIAIEEGNIESVDQHVLDFFSDRMPANMSAWKEGLTLEDLLTMTAGLDARDSWLYEWWGLDRMYESPDALQYVLDLEVIEEPGTRFEYTNGVSHLLSCIINETTGKSSLEYATETLFGPLGFDEVEWKNDSLGRNWGYSTLYLTPHDMAKFGYLFLNNGTWDGEQIVPESWVHDATRKHVDAPLWPGYGYQWWIDDWGHYLGLGYRGQLIYVVPVDNLVVVFTGSDPDNPPYVDNLLKKWILPAISFETPILPISD
jgi:CubicO group peptidase (beta-lactamase class C family)